MRFSHRRKLADAITMAALAYCLTRVFGDVTQYITINAVARASLNATAMPHPMPLFVNVIAGSKNSMLHLSASATAVAMLCVAGARLLVRRLDSAIVAILPLVAIAALWAGPAAILLAWKPGSLAEASERLAWARDFDDPVPSALVLAPFMIGTVLVGAVLTLRSVQAGRKRAAALA